MCENGTLGVQTADTRTWVSALVVDARPISGALVVGYTFGSAAAVRVAEIVGDTRARSGAILFLADGISSAWRR